MESKTKYESKMYPTKSGEMLSSKEMAETLKEAIEYANNQMQTTKDKRKIKKLQDRLRNIKLYVAQHDDIKPVSYTHLRAHETDSYLVCRLLLEKKKINNTN